MFVGYLAVYRVEFAAVCFFLLLAIIMLGVKSSRDPRSSIQNGFWAIKFLVLIAIVVGAFFIPTKDGKFTEGIYTVGLYINNTYIHDKRVNIRTHNFDIQLAYLTFSSDHAKSNIFMLYTFIFVLNGTTTYCISILYFFSEQCEFKEWRFIKNI